MEFEFEDLKNGNPRLKNGFYGIPLVERVRIVNRQSTSQMRIDVTNSHPFLDVGSIDIQFKKIVSPIKGFCRLFQGTIEEIEKYVNDTKIMCDYFNCKRRY